MTIKNNLVRASQEMPSTLGSALGESTAEMGHLKLDLEIDDKAPYEELFDRTQRTFSATYSKFRDNTFFTPVQRIGVYMDYGARLRKKHLHDLIAYLKVSVRA